MKGVSIYARKGRKCWYLAYWCPRKMKRVNESSEFRIDDPQGKKRALDLLQQKALHSSAMKPVLHGSEWVYWVPSFIRDRHKNSPRTLERYETSWKYLAGFFHEKRLHGPSAVTYDHMLEYLDWRQSGKKRSGKAPGRNTALLDLRVLSLIMRHALRRGWCTHNPAEKLGVRRDPPREKPELSDVEIAKIREELKKQPEWMQTAFEIALLQGCRLRETSVPFRRIDFSRRTIEFHAKGGRIFTTALNPQLLPLLNRLKDEGREVTCTIPRLAGRDFWRFFQKIGLPHVCFHCTRVTAVTRMARGGVPQAIAMRMVNHASQTIHRVYQRLGVPDLQQAIKALQF